MASGNIDQLRHWCSKGMAKDGKPNYLYRPMSWSSESMNPFDLKMNDRIEEVLLTMVFSQLVNQTITLTDLCPAYFGKILFMY